MDMDRRLFLASAASASLWMQPGAWAQTASAWRHPDLDRALELLRAQRWLNLCSLVERLPPQRAYVLMSDLADAAPLRTDFGDIATHPLGDAIIAAIETDWAWRFRGTGVASTVTETGLNNFLQNLNDAKVHVDRAIQLDPDNGIARSIGFRVNMGLSNRRALAEDLQGYLMSARRPVGGLSAYANAVSAKWLGSEHGALAFARETSSLDLPASAGLIPDVHFNCWGSRVMNNATYDFATYASGADVRAEIIAANEAYNSVGPDPDDFANWYANSWFSFALMAINELDLARPHFQRMGNYVGKPWSDLPDAARTIQAIRHAMGLEAL